MPKHTNADLVLLALQFYGTAAIPGGLSNPLVLGFFQKSGHPEITNDDTAWCSAFINSIARQLGAPSSGSLAARSWLTIGTGVPAPQFGDIAVFWRDAPKGTLGHVGIVIAAIGTDLWILGGNQKNRVEIEHFTTEKILGCRRLFTA